MTGHLEERTSQDIARLCNGIVNSDLDEIIDVIRSLTSADPALMRSRSFRNDLWQLVSQFQQGTLESLNVGSLLSEFFSLLRRYHIRCPSDLVYLIKSLTTIESVAASIDPSFDLITYVQPYLERLIRRRYSAKALANRARRATAGYLELLEDLPSNLKNLIEQLLNDRFQVHLEHRGLHDLTDTLIVVGKKLSSAVTLAALLVGSSILILADALKGTGPTIASAIGAIGYAISSAAALSSMIAFWRGK
jgi:ubiquinone biosynthesis protein